MMRVASRPSSSARVNVCHRGAIRNREPTTSPRTLPTRGYLSRRWPSSVLAARISVRDVGMGHTDDGVEATILACRPCDEAGHHPAPYGGQHLQVRSAGAQPGRAGGARTITAQAARFLE